jgi:hypothetical protein
MAIAGHRYRLALAVAGCLVLSSCTTVTDGTVQPAEGLALGPLDAAAIEKVLPNESQVADILGDRLPPDPDEPARSGGLSDMPDGLNSDAEASPHECVGAAAPLQRSIYRDTGVTDFASSEWELPRSDDGDILGTITGVVAFPSAAQANDVFDDFVKQWEACDGTVVELPMNDGGNFTDTITNVRVENSVVSADLETAKPSESLHWPRVRAIGVRANCLVEVDVSFFFDNDDPPPGLEDVAIELAHFMMGRIAEVG